MIQLHKEPLQATFAKYGIVTRLQQCHFLGQIDWESNGMTRLVESFNYTPAGIRSVWPTRFTEKVANELGRNGAQKAKQEVIANIAYNGRYGNVEAGDGWKFRGRGPIQCTFRSNYAEYSKSEYNTSGINFEADPDKMADPVHGLDFAGYYWRTRSINRYISEDLEKSVRGVTKKINPALHGLENRRKLTSYWINNIDKLFPKSEQCT